MELSSELGAPILERGKHFLDLGIFRLGLSNFWIGTWFPFDVFQFNGQVLRLKKDLKEALRLSAFRA